MKLLSLGFGILVFAAPLFGEFFGPTPTVARDEKTTWTADIRPIVAKKCASCHQPNGPAPFALLSYEDAERRATLIRYVAILKKMPPTDALSELGDLNEHAALSDLDIVKLQGWIRDGATEGTKSTPILPEKTPDPSPPTMEHEAKGPEIRAEGAPYQQTFVIPLKIGRNTRLVRFEAVPAQPKAVRHVMIAKADRTTAFPGSGIVSSRFLAAWAPGGHVWSSPVGLEIGQSDDLEVAVLCMPSGKAESGTIKLRLWFEDKTAPATSWLTIGVKDFTLPAVDDLFHISAETTLEKESDITAIHPEMRKYAMQLNIRATTPDGRVRNLFSIFSWDPAWLGAYNFGKPVTLPAGTKIKADAVYNNSGHAFGELRTTPSPVKSGGGPDEELFWIQLQVAPK